MDGGYDVIGDVHGEGTKLVKLLNKLGYVERNGSFIHPDRQALFVGDLIDRGPEQLLVLRTAKAMVDAGAAQVVMGNHEFNAIAFATPDPQVSWRHLRERNQKNTHQHEAFLRAVTPDSQLHGEIIDWFKTLPMWFEADGLRVVHACWDEDSLSALQHDPILNDELLLAATTSDTAEFNAVEVLLKGPEIDIDPGYFDKDGYPRNKARHAWWVQEPDEPIDRLVVPGGLSTDGTDDGPSWPPAEPKLEVGEAVVSPYLPDAPPVIFGHYWKTHVPQPTSVNTACVDYSACKGNDLVAYRWSGETRLSAHNFFA